MKQEYETPTITPIGITNCRKIQQPFGIKDSDRLNHIYAIGKSGSEKTTLLLNIAISDIINCKGICVIGPHGDLAETLLALIETLIRDFHNKFENVKATAVPDFPDQI